MSAIYKGGETAQKDDQVMGKVKGLAARGKVLGVRENGDILITRRAPYEGNTKPLASIHDEVPAAEFSLVYRPAPARPGPAVPPQKVPAGAKRPARNSAEAVAADKSANKKPVGAAAK